uniref:GPI ethanolamine phosphate transferase 2 isoform X2 n=1 Tax=Geotrypetes seraphini TaxID=260995 RepID=A0A6P8PAX1_GEOSA|nr:GPI ethanolamine phosphate transferase 2 isoform X2 [Geotrypetes seraphini]
MRVRGSLGVTCCVLLQAVAVALFLRGFFPAPVRSLNHLAETLVEPNAGGISNWTSLPPPLFGRVIIVLIDALREDFVFGPKGKEFMPYMTHLVEKGTSHSFVAKATAPTVTMPRIKALMTGSIPGFIDVIMNLNSPALLEDNLIWQAKTAGKRMIFYGDDTWLRLFPKHFVEYDGTTSFFVSDFTEESDNVLPSLLVLCGDHGMTEAGGHGGSSDEEVHTPLIFVSTVFDKKEGYDRPLELIQQTDLAPTLAVSLGLPISRNSLGKLILPVVEGRTLREQLRFLHLNGFQLSRLLQENMPAYEKDIGFEQFKTAEKSHGNWIKLYLDGNTSEVLTNLGKKVLKQYLDALKMLSSSLSKQMAQYDLYSMMVGSAIILEVLFLLLLSIPNALSSSAELDVPLSSPFFSLLFYLMCLLLSAVHVIVCTSTENSCYFCTISWLIAIGVMIFISGLLCVILSLLGKMCANTKSPKKSPLPSGYDRLELDVLLLVGTVGHVLTLGSSSFIEEEHQTWYFLINTLCLALSQQICRKYFLVKDSNVQLSTSRSKRYGDANESFSSKDSDIYTLPESDSKINKLNTSGLFKCYEKWIALASPWVILICCRLLRSLNQTGVQWAHRPDFGHWLTSSDHKAALSLLSAVSLGMIFVLVQRRCHLVSKIALALGLLGIYSYRSAIGNVVFPWQQHNQDISKGIIEARFVYVFVLGILFTGTKDLLKSQLFISDSKTKCKGLWEIYSGLVLLIALLFRPHNLPVLVFCLLIQNIMMTFIWNILKYDATQITIMHYWFGQAFFYFQGNSNNIATVDISAGFVGLDDFVEIPAILLTTIATYAGPLLWAIHLICYLSSEMIRSSSANAQGCFCYALLRSVPITVYIILVTSLRYHLFIWSVFSPKLLYEGIQAFLTAAICVFITAMDKN